ncbi:hypothetical protein WJX73_003611 [Symbiochloris irregularis]|uniref:Uncharacterized protein n=1 Tax=Symbiochloris irregularis TaxID=706552 RepID=A0AAW1NXY2_9CHLO
MCPRTTISLFSAAFGALQTAASGAQPDRDRDLDHPGLTISAYTPGETNLGLGCSPEHCASPSGSEGMLNRPDLHLCPTKDVQPGKLEAEFVLKARSILQAGSRELWLS